MSHERGQQFLLQLPSLRHDLPFSPALFEKLYRQTGDAEHSALSDLAATISRDQGLTAKVLTMANSAYYGLQSEVRTVSRAVAVLGLNEIRNLVLALGIGSIARNPKIPKTFNIAKYWEHQFSVALAARDLAGPMGAPDADSLFTAGVLHDFGKLLTALHRTGDWQAIERLRLEQNLPCHKAEERHWGLDHGLIGAMVLKSWNIPEELYEPVNWHHAPMRAPAQRRQALVLCVADAMVLSLDDPETPVAAPWREVLAKFAIPQADAEETVAAAMRSRDISTFASFLQ